MSIKHNSLIGVKFFNNNGVILRVKAIRSKNCFILEDKIGKTHKLSYNELSDNWIKLMPIGILSIYQVSIGSGNRDVIVTLHRIKDLEINIHVPYIAARQAIINIFAMPFENDINRIPLGHCMSIKTCPQNVDYSIMYQNEKVIASSIISVYLEDTVDGILKYVNTSNYDNTIKFFKRRFDKYNLKNVGDSLREFLDNNGFLSEFDTAFNIVNVNSLDEEDIIKGIEDKIDHHIHLVNMLKYNESVDLDRIKNRYDEYIFIREKETNDIYIIRFDKLDKIIRVPKNQIQYSTELVNMMTKLISKK